MTIPLHALIAQWREEAERHKTHGDSYRIGQGWALADCADELEAALASAVPRYDIAIDQEYGEAYIDVQPHPDGAWVRYGDL